MPLLKAKNRKMVDNEYGEPWGSQTLEVFPQVTSIKSSSCGYGVKFAISDNCYVILQHGNLDYMTKGLKYLTLSDFFRKRKISLEEYKV